MQRSAILLIALCFAGISESQTATAWPEADQLFHSDSRWLGADGAFSVDLGNGRVLWMFGDTFLGHTPRDSRSQASLIRNTVAIQTGYDPSTATMKFYWRDKHQASEIFPSHGNTWMWPLHGIRVENRLLLFCSRLAPDDSKNSLRFRSAGFVLYRVSNPEQEPTRWVMTKLHEDHGNLILASAVVRDGDFLYLAGFAEPEHDLYLVRWALSDVQSDRFRLQWWSGKDWQASRARARFIIRDVGTEASIQKNPRGGGFIEVNSEGFGATDIVLRTAPQLTGPWSEGHKIYRPPESNEPDAFVYAGKSHAELHGADVVVTYAANSMKERRLATDMSIYFPRFVRVQLLQSAPH